MTRFEFDQVAEGDGLPPYICQKCISKLNVAFQFKTQCEASDAKLRQVFENLNNLQSPNAYTGHFIDVKREDSNQTFQIEQANTLQNNESQVNSAEQTTITIETIPIQDTSQLGQSDLQTLQTVQLGENGALDTLNKNELEFKLEFNELKTQEIDIKEDELSKLLNGGSNTKTKNPKPIKQHQCDTCGKIFRTKPSLIHHIRIHTGERPYVCHLCDKRFVNGGHLHTHMRTHTGEKNHVCAACSKAFATAQQLTKHTIAIHTSERPYGCTYCPKRFASSSNLNTHIKIHTGEKNYHCDQCGKAFSTKGQLYQHMLVHTGEKAFLCEYCNKRFSQKAHLVRHLKMHKS